ncbi:odorant receptor 47b [Drosophila kikkawai]|uniref:Odorant receptor n=1 Tax=Drosophila kikkawai TaxID=30033 RepID=A0A6P4IW61_DROKI
MEMPTHLVRQLKHLVMADVGYQSNLGIMRHFLDEFRSVLRQETPGRIPRLALNYNRASLSLLCQYPNKKLAQLALYRGINWFIMCNVMLAFWTMVVALPESKNVIDMGDDLVWLSGMGLVFTKIFYMHLRCNDIDEIIWDFDYYNRELRPHHMDEEVLGWQRLCYLAETGLYINCFFLVNFFSAAVFLQPLISKGKLPFHVIWPFQWHRIDLHPKMFWVLYIWLSCTSQHNLMSILHVDMVGITTFLQTALNLKLLCIEMRRLGEMRKVSDARFHEEFCRVVRFHQHIISLVKRANKAFNGAFIAQMIASFSLISIATFETMAAASVDPKMAAKFVLLAMLAFIQLSTWCITGTLVYTQSLEVAQAAFEIKDWHTKSTEIQKDISFVILRAQKPLMYVAEPFVPFTLGTYMIVLKQCYRLLALLRESM